MKYILLSLSVLLITLSSCDDRPVEVHDLDAITIPLSVRPQEWVPDGDPNVEVINVWDAIFNVPEINRDVYDGGFVLIYREVFNPNGWKQLPYTEIYNNPDVPGSQYSIEYQFEYGLGEVEINFVNSRSDFDPNLDLPTQEEFFKAVVVTGDWIGNEYPKTYEEWEQVKKLYNVNEIDYGLELSPKKQNLKYD